MKYTYYKIQKLRKVESGHFENRRKTALLDEGMKYIAEKIIEQIRGNL